MDLVWLLIQTKQLYKVIVFENQGNWKIHRTLDYIKSYCSFLRCDHFSDLLKSYVLGKHIDILPGAVTGYLDFILKYSRDKGGAIDEATPANVLLWKFPPTQ